MTQIYIYRSDETGSTNAEKHVISLKIFDTLLKHVVHQVLQIRLVDLELGKKLHGGFHIQPLTMSEVLHSQYHKDTTCKMYGAKHLLSTEKCQCKYFQRF